jgi:aromatic ring-cleaving dioxygenase
MKQGLAFDRSSRQKASLLHVERKVLVGGLNRSVEISSSLMCQLVGCHSKCQWRVNYQFAQFAQQLPTLYVPKDPLTVFGCIW